MAKGKGVARFDEWPTQWLIINRNDGRIICWDRRVCLFPSRQMAREFSWYTIGEHRKATKIIPCRITPPKPKRKRRRAALRAVRGG